MIFNTLQQFAVKSLSLRTEAFIGPPNTILSNCFLVFHYNFEKVRDIFYALMREKPTSQATFADYAREARKMSDEVLNIEEAKVVDHALLFVGLYALRSHLYKSASSRSRRPDLIEITFKSCVNIAGQLGT